MSSDELLQQGIAAYRAGRKQEAYPLFRQAVKEDRRNEKAWLWLSGVVETDEERLNCLERVLEINPANEMARQGIEHLRRSNPSLAPSAPASAPPAPSQPAPPTPVPTVTLPPRPEPVPGRSSPPAPPPAPLARGPADPAQPPAGQAATSPAAGPAPARGEKKGVDWVMVVGACAILAILCVAGLLVVTSLQGANSSQPPESSGEITSVVYENIAAYNSEDLNRYMATIHSQAALYDQTLQTLRTAFGNYDLRATVEDVVLVKRNDNEAQVSFVLTTVKLRGPEFRNNKITGVFILRPEDGRWKLYDQKVEDVEYLD